jgi:hypothetical protein
MFFVVYIGYLYFWMYAEFLGSRKYIVWSCDLVILLLASKEEREESGFYNLFYNQSRLLSCIRVVYKTSCKWGLLQNISTKLYLFYNRGGASL